MVDPIVAFLPAAMDGCALYRMFIPHLNIPQSRFVFKVGTMELSLFVEASIAVVQRQATVSNYAALVELKKFGFKLVYDLDDNLWSVPAYNPSAKAFKQVREGFTTCSELCDVVTVSTRGLQLAAKTAISPKTDIVVVPNAMDFRLFRPPLVSRDDGRVVIGWAGSNTHDHDIQDAWTALPEIVEENPNVYLEIAGGALPPAELRHHPRVRIRPWTPIGEYGARFATWAWDIMLAPLEDNRFNRSKSQLKFLEAAAVNAACLASTVQPYVEFCELHSPLLTKHCLCYLRRDWKTKLTALIHDTALRQECATAIRKVAFEFYNIDRIKENWIWLFRQLSG